MAASGSPESEVSDAGSIECFHAYTPAEVFVQGLAGQFNQQDVESIIHAQKHMYVLRNDHIKQNMTCKIYPSYF